MLSATSNSPQTSSLSQESPSRLTSALSTLSRTPMKFNFALSAAAAVV